MQGSGVGVGKAYRENAMFRLGGARSALVLERLAAQMGLYR